MEDVRDIMLTQLLEDEGPYRDAWEYDGGGTKIKRIALNERMRRVFVAKIPTIVQILVPVSSTFGFAHNDSTTEGDSGMFSALVPLPPGNTLRIPMSPGDFLVMAVQSGQDSLGIVAYEDRGGAL